MDFLVLLFVYLPSFISSVSQKTGPLQEILHNFINSPHLLIILSMDRPYLVPN